MTLYFDVSVKSRIETAVPTRPQSFSGTFIPRMPLRTALPAQVALTGL
jgi:hypothetical protein